MSEAPAGGKVVDAVEAAGSNKHRLLRLAEWAANHVSDQQLTITVRPHVMRKLNSWVAVEHNVRGPSFRLNLHGRQFVVKDSGNRFDPYIRVLGADGNLIGAVEDDV